MQQPLYRCRTAFSNNSSSPSSILTLRAFDPRHFTQPSPPHHPIPPPSTATSALLHRTPPLLVLLLHPSTSLSPPLRKASRHHHRHPRPSPLPLSPSPNSIFLFIALPLLWDLCEPTPIHSPWDVCTLLGKLLRCIGFQTPLFTTLSSFCLFLQKGYLLLCPPLQEDPSFLVDHHLRCRREASLRLGQEGSYSFSDRCDPP